MGGVWRSARRALGHVRPLVVAGVVSVEEEVEAVTWRATIVVSTWLREQGCMRSKRPYLTHKGVLYKLEAALRFGTLVIVPNRC